MGVYIQFCLLVVVSVLSNALAIDVCSYSPLYTYCEDDYHCCENNTRCCADVNLSVAAIVGIVIGCIILFSCIVAVICAVAKKSHRPGQIIQPAQPTGVAVISTGHQPGQPMYGQPMYGQPSYGQPQYGIQQAQGVDKAGSSDPAYPPPPPPTYST